MGTIADEALKKEFGGDEEVKLIIRDLDDTQMLQIMARENMEEWGGSYSVVLDTIRVPKRALELAQELLTRAVQSIKSDWPGLAVLCRVSGPDDSRCPGKQDRDGRHLWRRVCTMAIGKARSLPMG